jgi:hypothetical protein
VIPIGEVARRLDVSEKTVKSWAERFGLSLSGLVPGRRFGSWSTVEEWTSAHGAAMKPAEPDRVHARFLAHVASAIEKGRPR